jgi:hypothetical protein
VLIYTIPCHIVLFGMTGLKSYLPILAATLGMTPAALYERQRALVHAKILRGPSGRGPGSGVRATPDSVAVLIMGALTTDSLVELPTAVRATAALPSVGGPCGLTGAGTFGEAIVAVLSSTEIAERVHIIEVERPWFQACIRFTPKRRKRLDLTSFGSGKGKDDMDCLSTTASLPGTAVSLTSEDLQKIGSGKKLNPAIEDYASRIASEVDARARRTR